MEVSDDGSWPVWRGGAASTGVRVGAGLIAVAIVAATVLAVRALRRQAVVVETGRIGRRRGWSGSIGWCDLADVRHQSLVEYRTLLGGRQRHLVLWTVHGGASGPAAAIGTMGIPPQERAAVAAAKDANPGLRPFIVPLSGMRPEHAEHVLAAAGR